MFCLGLAMALRPGAYGRYNFAHDSVSSNSRQVLTQIIRSPAQPEPKRSAPVLGRSNLRLANSCRNAGHALFVESRCARGRAHSDAVEKIFAKLADLFL